MNNLKTKLKMIVLRNGTLYILLGAISVLFLLIFSGHTSPLYKDWHGFDSAFFMMVGQGMKQGLLPYRDFFDQKGPYLFLLQYIGQLIVDGRTGCFIMQIINLFVILVFACKIYDLVDTEKRLIFKLLSLVPLLIFMGATMENGNLTEEYCNSFVFISLYFYLKHLSQSIENRAHPPLYAFIYGMCFGVISLIRVDNSILICAIVLTMLVFEIKGKRFKNLIYNIFYMLIGLILSWLPICIFYAFSGELGNMLYHTFVIATQYALNTSRKYFYYFVFIPTFWSIALYVFLFKDNIRPKAQLFCLLCSIAYCIYYASHNQYFHYFETALPLITLGIWILASAFNGKTAWIKTVKKKTLIGLIICTTAISLAYPSFQSLRSLRIYYARLTTNITAKHINRANQVKENIPLSDRAKVYAYEAPVNWYVITGIWPYNKYCAWQDSYAKINTKIANEIEEIFEKQPPLYVVTSATANISNIRFTNRLYNEYELCFCNESYNLYVRINKQ